MLYPEETVQSQYAASPTIRALVDGINKELDPRADIKLFYDKIYNPRTAQGVGLDYWARIVGVQRNIYITDLSDTFGFWMSGGTQEWEPWDQGIFYTPEYAQQGSYRIDDGAFRRFIFWKALANISTADCYTLNRLLTKLFDNPVIVTETGVMEIRITTTRPLEDWQKAVMIQYGLFGKPAGVGYEFWTVVTPVLGFVRDGDNYMPLGQAPFFSGVMESDFGGN
jgi:hypothetical protein